MSCSPKPQRRAREALALLPGLGGIQVFGDRLHLRLRDGGPDEAAIRAHLAAHGVEARGLRAVAPVLEDVFISLLTSSESTGEGSPSRGDGSSQHMPEPQGWREGEASAARTEGSTVEVRSDRTPQPARARRFPAEWLRPCRR